MAPAEVGGRLELADIRLVVGTRPEAIKLAPVAEALAVRGARPHLILTGQHTALDPVEFGMGQYRVTRLHCPGVTNPHDHVKTVTQSLLPHLRDAPDLLIVQGDTSSALGGALAGFAAGIAVAHVEAGLRSHDVSMPWPEEEYRVAIDAWADLLFAPTEGAAANLRAEGVPGAIFVTGNSGIDAVMKVLSEMPAPLLRDAGVPRVLVSCHRRESWDRGLESIATALLELAASGCAVIDVLLHPNAYVRGRIQRLLGTQGNINLLPSCGHRELIARMRDCDLMLSDSGGVQEEAPAIGLPLLVLREKTERPEGIETGNMRLVGTDTGQIVAAVHALLSDPAARAEMARPSLPYGDGRTGPRIAAIIEEFLKGTAQNLNIRIG